MKIGSVKDPVLWTLLGVNLMPTFGYFFFGWKMADLLVLFWAETFVFFLVAGMRVLTAPKNLLWVNLFGGLFVGGWILLAALWFIRGLDPRLAAGTNEGPFWPFVNMILKDRLWIQVLPLSLLQWGQFLQNSYERAQAKDQVRAQKEALDETIQSLAEPLKRVILLFISMTVGLLVAPLFNVFNGVFFFLLALKTLSDVYVHWNPGRSGPEPL
jgi:hypothetical protein